MIHRSRSRFGSRSESRSHSPAQLGSTRLSTRVFFFPSFLLFLHTFTHSFVLFLLFTRPLPSLPSCVSPFSLPRFLACFFSLFPPPPFFLFFTVTDRQIETLGLLYDNLLVPALDLVDRKNGALRIGFLGFFFFCFFYPFLRCTVLLWAILFMLFMQERTHVGFEDLAQERLNAQR